MVCANSRCFTFLPVGLLLGFCIAAAAAEPEQFKRLEQLWNDWWGTKDPRLFRSRWSEPSYRHLDDDTEDSQNRFTETIQRYASTIQLPRTPAAAARTARAELWSHVRTVAELGDLRRLLIGPP